jgi:hypothetical protein
MPVGTAGAGSEGELMVRAGQRGLRLAAAALAVPAVVVVLAWFFWPSAKPPQPRAREYLAFTACLLTDQSGTGGTDAAPVWAGLEDASLSTHARVQFAPVVGAQTVDNALPFLASLAQGGCDLVFAVGPLPVAAVKESAKRFPHTRFVVVGVGPAQPNVSIVDTTTAAEVRAGVARLVAAAVGISRGA